MIRNIPVVEQSSRRATTPFLRSVRTIRRRRLDAERYDSLAADLRAQPTLIDCVVECDT